MSLKSLFDEDKKYLARYEQEADKIIDLASKYEKLSDDELKAKTEEFKK